MQKWRGVRRIESHGRIIVRKKEERMYKKEDERWHKQQWWAPYVAHEDENIGKRIIKRDINIIITKGFIRELKVMCYRPIPKLRVHTHTSLSRFTVCIDTSDLRVFSQFPVPYFHDYPNTSLPRLLVFLYPFKISLTVKLQFVCYCSFIFMWCLFLRLERQPCSAQDLQFSVLRSLSSALSKCSYL